MENRPEYLSANIKFYSEFPKGYDLDIDYSKLPALLNFDFHTLNGILPLTSSRFDYIGKNGDVDGEATSIVLVNPLAAEYDYFESIGVTEFQAISLVVNFYAVEEVETKTVRGIPYAVSLLPMTENNKIDTWNIELLKQSNLEKLCQQKTFVFTSYNPFSGWRNGMVAPYPLFSQMTSMEPTDSIGFQWGMYFLTPVFDKKEVRIPENQTYSKEVNAKYRKYKVSRYFKPFKNSNPRQIWGCDSPIELFLLQGLYIRNNVPEIQMGFYSGGEIFPNYYRMAEEEVFVPEDRLITTADFYFPNEKLAVFCDGREFHDEKKDQRINSELESIGVKVLRFSGKRITEELETVLDEIESILSD